MSDLRDWFTIEMGKLGYAGLEGIFDYLASMSDANVPPYMENMLGDGPGVKRLVESYLRRRANKADHNTAPESNKSLQNASSGGWNMASSQLKKSKRGKGKGRNGNRDSSKEKKPLYATAAAGKQDAAVNSKVSQAIRNSPAERARQMVREYRKSKAPINCVKCGLIECPIREDGTCSFCHSPIFSLNDRQEALEKPVSRTREKSVSSVTKGLTRLKIDQKGQKTKEFTYRNPSISNEERKKWDLGLKRALAGK